MERTQILEERGKFGLLPTKAIEAARREKTALAPEFIAIIEDLAAGRTEDRSNLPFFAFHLLGEWRDKSACKPILRFLRSPAARLLDDAIAETSQRVMFAVFDGDSGPLRELILDPDADEFVRSRMLEAMAALAWAGEIRRDEATEFLRNCFSAFEHQIGSFVWNGWQSAVALLGVEELVPLVREAFEREFIDPGWLGFCHFERDLRDALQNPDELPPEFRPLDDVIAEFSRWYGFTQARLDEQMRIDDEPALDWSLPEPAVNVHRHVGRNDPCPCGSGRKFKKCCLAEAA